MSNEPRSAHETLAQRKERLIMQCRAYRAAVHHSRSEMRSRLGLQSIAKAAAGLVGLRAGSSMLANVTGMLSAKGGGLPLGKVKALLPIVTGAYSLLSRRSLLRPALRGAMVLGGLGAAFCLYRRQAKKSRHDHAAHHEHL
jgi:hypothetical protein